MAAEVTNDEPVLMLEDKKYIIDELSDEAKIAIAQINDLQQQLNINSARAAQNQMAIAGFTEQLRGLVEPAEDEPEEAQVMN
jgi:hypothetical protein